MRKAHNGQPHQDREHVGLGPADPLSSKSNIKGGDRPGGLNYPHFKGKSEDHKPSGRPAYR